MTDTERNSRVCQSIVELVIGSGGGMIPESGTFTAAVWAKLIGVDARTVARWVRQYKIPYTKSGREIFIDAVDLRQCVPRFNAS